MSISSQNKACGRLGACWIVGFVIVFMDENLAEKEGFEPSVQLPVHMISSQAHSIALAFLRCKLNAIFKQIKKKTRGKKRNHPFLPPQ